MCISSQNHNAEYKRTCRTVLWNEQDVGEACCRNSFVFEKGFSSSSQYWVNVSARKATPLLTWTLNRITKNKTETSAASPFKQKMIPWFTKEQIKNGHNKIKKLILNTNKRIVPFTYLFVNLNPTYLSWNDLIIKPASRLFVDLIIKLLFPLSITWNWSKNMDGGPLTSSGSTLLSVSEFLWSSIKTRACSPSLSRKSCCVSRLSSRC